MTVELSREAAGRLLAEHVGETSGDWEDSVSAIQAAYRQGAQDMREAAAEVAMDTSDDYVGEEIAARIRAIERLRAQPWEEP